VLAPGGTLAAFDGDYISTTLAIGPDDPLQVCVDAMMRASVTSHYVMRRLASMIIQAGFVASCSRSHGFVETQTPDYMLTVVDPGADLLGSWAVRDSLSRLESRAGHCGGSIATGAPPPSDTHASRTATARVIRGWRLGRRNTLTFHEIASMINRLVADWINCYGRNS
jgi:hypothetical protein